MDGSAMLLAAIAWMAVVDQYSKPPPKIRRKYDEIKNLGWGKQCQSCGTDGLHWERFRGNWRLFTNKNKIHRCPCRPLDEEYEEFDRCGLK